MFKLNPRQEKILELFLEYPELDIANIERSLNESISRVTLNRDLAYLLKLDLIIRSGEGKNTVYKLSPLYKLIQPIDIKQYFSAIPDKRFIEESFNFNIFKLIDKVSEKIFSSSELEHIEQLNNTYRSNLKQHSKTIIRKEFERLTIDLSWKSSQIEGNTYSLLDTETLFKVGIEAKGHSKEEAKMLLNHKHALEYILEKPAYFKKITPNKIIELHSMLTKGLYINPNFRNSLVGITGTNYKPLDNVFQISDSIKSLSETVNKIKEPFTKALICSALISYTQAFEDGNKRTSRITSNALLLAYNYCPLSYRSIDETEYKKAMILFYERNNLLYLKELFIEQFEFAVRNYFQ
jgi:Fic family protein